MSKAGCIVIDIGNTSTALGFYTSGAFSLCDKSSHRLPQIRTDNKCKNLCQSVSICGQKLHALGRVSRIHHFRGGIAKNAPQIRLALESLCAAGTPERVVMASVVPAVNARWMRLLKKDFALPTLLVTCKTPMPIGIRYPKPETIGADRLVNACGAFVRYGTPAIVADFGTALTFDVLSREGDYIGGVIAPGLPLMTDYLYEKTALLPRIDLAGRCPDIGTSTESAMRIGARIGHRGMVRETIRHLLATTGRRTTLCATGGYARWALDGIALPFHIDPDLTLFGLGVVHDYTAITPSQSNP